MFETEPKEPLTFIKLGSLREKDLLKTARQAYDGILVTASMIESFGSSVPSFIRGLDKPFIIDPMVYAFVQPITHMMAAKDSKIKRSLIEISVRYGSIVQREIGKRPISCQDFQSNPGNVEELTKNVLNYQLERLKRPPSFADYYSEFELLLPQVEPEVLIPPYFYFKDTQDPWYSVSLEFARQALNVKEQGWKIFPVILMPPQLLEKQQEIEAIVGDYISDNYDGFFIWVNDFKEEDASVKQLQGLIKLVTMLAGSRKPVLKLYGGYFSALLWHADLTGFSFGLGYGSSKNVFAYGGARGAPNPLYYMPELHRLLSLPKAEDLIRRYPGLMCNCPTCKTVIGVNPANLSRMKDSNRTAQHFLNVRLREIGDLSKANIASISTGLEKSVQNFDQKLLSGINIDNLRKWNRALLEVKVPIAVA
jgi:hypothetical protein